MKLNPEGVHYSELYSDGKMICDGLLAEDQKLISCPACAHLFWLPHQEVRPLDTEAIMKDQTIYPFSSWNQFGCDSTLFEGKIALIEHYHHLLHCIRPLGSEVELYLRKNLLWAINDLIRQRSETRLIRLLTGRSRLANWKAGRRRQIRQNIAFFEYHKIHTSNLQRLIELLRSNEDREMNRVFLCELYRQKGNFSKCLEMVGQLRRSTHYLALIEEKARLHNSLVFKVAG
jgi:hypothetical protein